MVCRRASGSRWLDLGPELRLFESSLQKCCRRAPVIVAYCVPHSSMLLCDTHEMPLRTSECR